ncbi:MAG: Crp/Fnr family transcriptional regulator [Verrucomicrobiales bacterium]|nr:cyclic nucleotide-binding domain-containing protein [Verrucomicrobiae bacterium]MCP5552890.1 cyclic nucleotide-binding domain-containing protein [Akkermansiaceae bacterium]
MDTNEIDEILTLLKANETFAGAKESVLASLARQFEVRECAAGEEVVTQGRRSGRVFVIRSGQCEVVEASKGSSRSVALLGPGRVFGEIGAVSGRGATATVRVNEVTQLLVLEATALHKAMQECGELATSVLRSMQRYL